ncbi:SusC/RagA family TonB-linked outer membrane protein [Aequorivita marisscotiae]|uniref:TonB-dependent receptor n=1 Tax=Aequorivita marisscotiae TaxID=3040348 RepID=A0ABY8KT70_9FLAO|nr:TonB-dependent receptor [Aequorivita sp. Ant34-E75]WGF92183.1 TonB-dependent receptor [Aequorivita sp. Ant34-E75]
MKNKHRQRLLLAGIFVFSLAHNSPLLSQNLPLKSISGTITDAQGPLSGVNVLVKNTSRGSISDLEGRYSVTASSNDTLVFKYLGYKPVEVAVGINSVINLAMQPNATALDVVVINAGYYKVSDREKTGSITKISAKEIENQPVDNPLAALQGRVAGLNIIPLTGLSGGGYTVNIRGKSSIAAGNEPLYVIDGIPYNSSTLSDQSLSGAILPGGQLSPLSLINPNDIESIEVLKDADATAIYGSRGANGVVLITTKSGKAGDTKYSVSATSGVAHITRGVNTLNTQQYLKMRKEAFANDGITEYPEYAYDINGTWDPNRYTDWQKQLMGKTARLRTWEASISGGSKNNHFLVSAAHRNETTVFMGDAEYGRTSVRAQLDHSSKDSKFNIGFSAGYTIEDNNLPSGDLTFKAIGLPPNAPTLYDENGDLNWENGTFDNPLAQLNASYTSKRNTLVSSINVSYKLFKDLNIKSTFGFQDSRIDERRILPSTIYNPAYGFDSSSSSVDSNQGSRNSWIAEPQLNYSHKLAGGNLEILIGGSFQSETRQCFSQLAYGFPSNSLLGNLAAASLQFIINDNTTDYKYEAVFGRLNYNYKNKYILNLTARRDGSSRFGPGNRFANFGAIGAAWLFNEEQIVKENLPFLNLGKLRGSYGSTGNDQIGDYQYLDTYSVSGNPYNGTIGLSPTQLFNPNFGWEINYKAEIALELGFLKDRIYLETNYYRNRSTNQLVGMPLPSTTGFQSIQANLGAKVENSGWEINLRTLNVKGEKFKWNSIFNISLPKNKLLAFPGLEASTYSNRYVLGQPITIRKLYHFTGVDPQTGIYQFEDYNGDGSISSPDDRQYIVDTAPKFYGGLSNTWSYGNWQFDVFFQFSKQQSFNYWYAGSPAGTMVNQPTAVLDHWQQPGDNAQTQLYTTGSNAEAVNAFYKFSVSSAAFSDASYIRLKNTSISYTLPFEKMQCKLFLEAQNLLTITNYKGGDPEQLTGFLPPLRRFSGGVQLNF